MVDGSSVVVQKGLKLSHPFHKTQVGIPQEFLDDFTRSWLMKVIVP
ncbi:hypothetical protein SETIT_5G103400v2 [Setaria italica]|uniref:Uncharacterized protein n=1 Tax=Setaria italica TaxID=4555 RepID=A0A368R388_SETIT|nr:hypothetical protein SETIT_5G103400v2 [Setaria italica]